MLPKFYLVFLKKLKHFHMLTLAVVFFSQLFFLPMVIYSDELFSPVFVPL